MHISFIGMPGCGKSTVGKLVAKRLGVGFVDADRAIEQSAGCRIAEIFSGGGEVAFRAIESRVLADLVQGASVVIATGGGAVVRAENRELLRMKTICIYLHTSMDTLMRRLRRDTRRPLLQVADPEARLREMSAEREPLYRETATIVIDTAGYSLNRLVEAVLSRLPSAPIAAR